MIDLIEFQDYEQGWEDAYEDKPCPPRRDCTQSYWEGYHDFLEEHELNTCLKWEE